MLGRVGKDELEKLWHSPQLDNESLWKEGMKDAYESCCSGWIWSERNFIQTGRQVSWLSLWFKILMGNSRTVRKTWSRVCWEERTNDDIDLSCAFEMTLVYPASIVQGGFSQHWLLCWCLDQISLCWGHEQHF